MADRVPAAIVFGFKNGRALEGMFPLFTRVPIAESTYPTEFTKILGTVPALTGGATSGTFFSDGWVLTAIKVNQTRFWACDTAVITISLDLSDPTEPFLPAPTHPEQPLTITMGWTEDLYGVPDLAHLTRVFTGYVDTVSYKLTPTRVIATIALRDPIRFLVDNKLTELFTDTYVAGQKQTEGSGTPFLQGGRQALIRALIRDGSGTFYDGAPAIPDERIYTHESGRQAIGTTVGSAQQDGVNGTGSKVGQQLFVHNRFPMELIKHLSTVEPTPMEIYADASGYVYWDTRRTLLGDIELLSGEKISYKPKDYYFRNPVTIDASHTDGEPQPILSGTMEWSTIGTITKFVVSNSGPEGDNSVANIGYIDPTKVHGFDMAQKTRFIFDDTSDKSVMETAAFLDAMLQLWGKDVRAGAIEVEGDATMTPARAVRLWRVGLYPPPDNMFRVESVVHLFSGSGAKKGFRTSMMISATEESLREFTTYTTKEPSTVKQES